LLIIEQKEKGDICFSLTWVYGRFLSIISITKARTMIIRTNSPAIDGTKYMSATDCGVGVGAAVAAGACATAKEVSEFDGQ